MSNFDNAIWHNGIATICLPRCNAAMWAIQSKHSKQIYRIFFFFFIIISIFSVFFHTTKLIFLVCEQNTHTPKITIQIVSWTFNNITNIIAKQKQ